MTICIRNPNKHAAVFNLSESMTCANIAHWVNWKYTDILQNTNAQDNIWKKPYIFRFVVSYYGWTKRLLLFELKLNWPIVIILQILIKGFLNIQILSSQFTTKTNKQMTHDWNDIRSIYIVWFNWYINVLFE